MRRNTGRLNATVSDGEVHWAASYTGYRFEKTFGFHMRIESISFPLPTELWISTEGYCFHYLVSCTVWLHLLQAKVIQHFIPPHLKKLSEILLLVTLTFWLAPPPPCTASTPPWSVYIWFNAISTKSIKWNQQFQEDYAIPLPIWKWKLNPPPIFTNQILNNVQFRKMISSRCWNGR